MLVVFLVASALLSGLQAAQTRSNQARHAMGGTFKIWVPAGMIGDNYWIYLNGHIASAPPRGTSDPRNNNLVVVPSGKLDAHGKRTTIDGWELWGANGRVLKMKHENYEGLTDYINSESGDALHIFQVTELPLHTGKYTVEVAMLSGAPSSGTVLSANPFPFVVTRKYVVDVGTDQPTRLYVAVPDNWSSNPEPIPALAANRVCPASTAAAPDVDQMKGWIEDYKTDPAVMMLHDARATLPAQTNGIVVLARPVAPGGPREFDGSQVRDIVDTIAARHVFPSEDEVAACQARFPQFSESYGVYGNLIRFIAKDMASLRKLGTDLSAASSP